MASQETLRLRVAEGDAQQARFAEKDSSHAKAISEPALICSDSLHFMHCGAPNSRPRAARLVHNLHDLAARCTSRALPWASVSTLSVSSAGANRSLGTTRIETINSPVGVIEKARDTPIERRQRTLKSLHPSAFESFKVRSSAERGRQRARQGKVEPAAFAQFALRPYFAAVSYDDASRNVKAKPNPAAIVLTDLPKSFEDHL